MVVYTARPFETASTHSLAPPEVRAGRRRHATDLETQTKGAQAEGHSAVPNFHGICIVNHSILDINLIRTNTTCT